MTQGVYDLVVIGGGLGGSALALSMARNGARVFMVERDEVFKDRIRGEGMTLWGTAEARELGIFDLLRESCGFEVRYIDQYAGPMHNRRDLLVTTPQGAPCLGF